MLFLAPNPVMFIFLKGTVRLKWFLWYLLFDREILLSFMMVGVAEHKFFSGKAALKQ